MRKLLLVTVAASQLALAAPASPPAGPDAARRQHNLQVFDTAWAEVRKRYYDKTMGGLDWAALREEYRPKAAAARNDPELYFNVIQPLLKKFPGSHIGAAPPPVRFAADAPGSAPCPGGFGDIGVTLGRSWDPKEAAAVVAVVDKGSPAEAAGIAPGAKLRRYYARRSSCDTARVTLVLAATSEAPQRVVRYDLTAPRARPAREARTLPSGRRLIRFDEFDAANVNWAIAELRRAPRDGVVLDLRSNNGGLLDSAATFAGALLPAQSRLGVLKRARSTQVMTPHPARGGFRYAGPVAVLVGPATSSAAEITAEALRHHHRAVLVGSRTNGRVMVGHDEALPGGGKLQVTVGDYVAPSGKRLEGVGVFPDVAAQETLEAIRADRDLVVEAAEAALTPPGRPTVAAAAS